MSAKNLSICFAPSNLRTNNLKKMIDDTPKAQLLFSTLIENFQIIFKDYEELEEEEVVEDQNQELVINHISNNGDYFGVATNKGIKIFTVEKFFNVQKHEYDINIILIFESIIQNKK
jgi:hypothetical protein